MIEADAFQFAALTKGCQPLIFTCRGYSTYKGWQPSRRFEMHPIEAFILLSIQLGYFCYFTTF